MESVGKVADHQVQCTLSAGSSQLTLAVADIDAGVTSGTATLSGIWQGVAVHWTGNVDLTSNPLVNRPITGWPTGAFATELEEAAFFAPLGKVLAGTLIATAISDGVAGAHHVESAGGVFGRAGA